MKVGPGLSLNSLCDCCSVGQPPTSSPSSTGMQLETQAIRFQNWAMPGSSVVCDGVDLKWVTLCLSRWHERERVSRRSEEKQKVLPGYQVSQGNRSIKEVARIVADRDWFPESSQSHTRADKFLAWPILDRRLSLVRWHFSSTRDVMQMLAWLMASAGRKGNCCWVCFSLCYQG